MKVHGVIDVRSPHREDYNYNTIMVNTVAVILWSRPFSNQIQIYDYGKSRNELKTILRLCLLFDPIPWRQVG